MCSSPENNRIESPLIPYEWSSAFFTEPGGKKNGEREREQRGPELLPNNSVIKATYRL